MSELIKFIKNNSFFLLFILLEGVALLLITQYNSFQRSAVINTTRTLTGSLYQNFQGYRDYFNLRKINFDLHMENVYLRNQLAIRSSDEDNGYTLSLPGDVKYEYIPARVINNTVSRQYNYITLSAGKAAGMATDMAVISHNGIVGVTIGVSEHYTVVLPILNRNFRVSAKIKRNNYFGIAEWDGLNRQYVLLREIPLHVEVLEGDTVVSSGHSAIFPEGIPIGVVNEISAGASNFYNIKLKLLTDFGNLQHVTVIRNNYQEEQLELEENSGQ